MCRVGSNVCRIRYDFTVKRNAKFQFLPKKRRLEHMYSHFICFSLQIFALTGPAVGTTVVTGTGGGVNAGNFV